MGSAPGTAAGCEAEDVAAAPSRAGCASSQLRTAAAPRQDEAISCPASGSSGDTKKKRRA